METIGKFRTNFLGNKNSFNIGFNNRSPFSYKSSMPTDFISVPIVSANPGDYSLSSKTNYASINSGGKEFTQGLINIGKAIKENKDKKKEKKEAEEKEDNTKNGAPKGEEKLKGSKVNSNPSVSLGYIPTKIHTLFGGQ